MFYDFNIKSTGDFYIKATLTGSYGEQIYTACGRNYKDVRAAAEAAQRLVDKGVPDVTLINRRTGRVFYFRGTTHTDGDNPIPAQHHAA